MGTRSKTTMKSESHDSKRRSTRPAISSDPFAAHAASQPAPEEVEELVAQAMRLLSTGCFSPCPCCAPTENGNCTAPGHGIPCTSSGKPGAGKRPLIKGYPRLADSPPEPWQVRRWVNDFGLFNLAGVVRPPFVVIECDSLAAEQELLALDPRLVDEGPCRERRPTRGRGWVFRVARGETYRSTSGLGKSGAIDVIAPGKPFVLEPSVHVTGHRVRWVEGRAPWEVPALPISPPVVGLLARSRGQASGRGAQSGAPRPSASAQPAQSRRVPPRVQFLLRSDLRVKNAWHRRGKRQGDQSASGYDATLACLLLHRGVAVNVVVDALLACPGASKHSTEYAERTVSAALALLGNTRPKRWA